MAKQENDVVHEGECSERRDKLYARIRGNWVVALVIVIPIVVTMIGASFIFVQRMAQVETKVEAQKEMLQEIKRDVKYIRENGKH